MECGKSRTIVEGELWGNRLDKYIGDLRGTPLSLEGLRDIHPIPKMLDPFAVKRALMNAERRIDKWVRKRGKNISKVSLQNLTQRYIMLAFIEEVYRAILGYYGIVGRDTISYVNFCLSVVKAFRKYRGSSLIKRVKKLIEDYKADIKADREILRVLALATIKTIRYVEIEYSDVTFKKEEEG